MSKTKISWCDEVWNPIIGCSHSGSPGCDHCWAQRMAYRLKKMGRPEYQEVVDDAGHWTGAVKVVKSRLEQPFHWRKPRRVFVCSMSDLFHPNGHDGWIGLIYDTMRAATNHTFFILTKRPSRMQNVLSIWHEWYMMGARLPDNIWVGVSIEDQATADFRIPWLLRTPALHRFVSVEPMLGTVDLRYWMFDGARRDDHPKYKRYEYPTGAISWVICGAESGPRRRFFDVAWAEDLYEQCEGASVPYFFKQGSALRPGQNDELPNYGRIKQWPES